MKSTARLIFSQLCYTGELQLPQRTVRPERPITRWQCGAVLWISPAPAAELAEREATEKLYSQARVWLKTSELKM